MYKPGVSYSIFGRQLRRLYRRFFPRVPQQKADKILKRLRFLTAFFSWNAVGILVYYALTKEPTSEVDKRKMALGWAEPLMGDVKSIKIHGISKIEYVSDFKQPLDDQQTSGDNSSETLTDD